MVTYGGMSKKPITVSTSSFIFKDLSLKGFWLQKWLNSDKATECRNMIDYLLCLPREGKLKYEMELVPFDNFQSALGKDYRVANLNKSSSSNAYDLTPEKDGI